MDTSLQKLRTQLGLSGRPVVAVQGLGFVGAAMAVVTAAARTPAGQPCFDVIGVDLDTPQGRERVRCIANGIFPFASPDPKITDALSAAHRCGNLVATTDAAAFRLANIAVVDVHLDLSPASDEASSVEFGAFEAAIRTLGRELPAGALVVVETTVPPGTCANVVAPALKHELRQRKMPEDSILLAHSYERVMPGPDYFDSIVNFWRVYAGHTAAAADACELFLSRIVNTRKYPLRRLASTTASETAKVLENSYRAANIAFIEEWGRFAEAVGVDLFEVLSAVRDRPTHNNIRQPGFGVGGYCLTKDPLFALAASRKFLPNSKLDFPFSKMAIAVNRKMPVVNVERIEQFTGSLAGKTVIMLGVAYRSEVDDTRNAPAEQFYRELARRGAHVVCHDPFVRHWKELNIDLIENLPDPADADIVAFTVPHKAYCNLDVLAWLHGSKPFIYDCDDILSDQKRAELRASGLIVESTGRGVGL